VSGTARFAHASEAELARILDYYDVRWEYEPHTFPIMWNLEGAVVESFAPDFYLPEMDLYVELTTLKQSLVRRKNRKLRRLRELYPDVRVKLFYGKDFKALMLKYGRFDVAASFSGLEGQVLAHNTLTARIGATAAAETLGVGGALTALVAGPAVPLEAPGDAAPADQAVSEREDREPGTVRGRPSRGMRRRRARRLFRAGAGA
jgi:hypothetical protein